MLSEYRMLLLQRKPTLGCTKLSTGPHAGRGLYKTDLNVLNSCSNRPKFLGLRFHSPGSGNHFTRRSKF